MAKTGQTKSTTTKDKDFAGSGVEGQKGQDAEQVTPPVDPAADTASDETAPPVDPAADTASDETAPPVDPAADPTSDDPTPPVDPESDVPSVQTATEPPEHASPVPQVITGEHVLQQLRDKGHQV